ncbi:hypothetical protein ACSW8S_15490 (plasmid) [Clostridium perfringens]
MGRGNSCVYGDYEGLYYIDWDNFLYEPEENDGLMNDWECQREQFDDSMDIFKEDFIDKFKSFTDCDKWISKTEKAILENSLFYIAIEDNDWSIAIKLMQKEQDCYCEGNLANLQKRHFENYLNGIRDVLFNQFNELGVYDGPWTSGIIHKADFVKNTN